jgi:hypothetical protein
MVAVRTSSVTISTFWGETSVARPPNYRLLDAQPFTGRS